MTLVLPPCPASLRQIQHYLKVALEHETRDPVVTYWCRLFALHSALKIDKKSDESKILLVKLMDWLELEKKVHSSNEAITNEIAAQAHVENYALKLFMWADGQDRAGIFNKNVVKAFYTAGMVMDILNIFGELSEDIAANCKYAKWKAAYLHNCLKNGETPIPGPISMENDENNEAFGFSGVPGTNIEETNESENEQITKPSGPQIKIPSNPPTPAVTPQPITQNNINPFSPDPSSTTTSSSNGALIASGTGVSLEPSQITRAQKYCKFAASALNYDDVADAINYLHKALRLLETGQES